MVKLLYTLFLLFSFATLAGAQIHVPDPWDPLDNTEAVDISKDQDKTARELIIEATYLMYGNPLAARSKLILALKKDPKNLGALTLLGSYYHQQVQHYRLAMKYYKRAEIVLEEKYGKPPYLFNFTAKRFHKDIIRMLIETRQNLDNYEGALETIREYEIYGYSDPYLPSSKAWILFKLNRIKEAIQVAEQAPRNGHILNILGILYSVSGEREKAIEILKTAYQFEKNLGILGQAATPLNNVGEVYRESFQEEDATSSWQKAVKLRDGCEHILPSYNLANIYIESLQLDAAMDALLKFQSCFAQYPLRNGEEHKAILFLTKGRIALYRGQVDLALEHLRSAIEMQQWFGKIGTHIEDLQAAIYQNFSLAHERKSVFLSYKANKSFFEALENWIKIKQNRIKARWYARKAKLLLTESLNDFEDAYIRHTDSMLDYPVLGKLFQAIPLVTTKRFIKKMEKEDNRNPANLYYQAYLAESTLHQGSKKTAKALLKKIFSDPRSDYDLALKIHTQALYLSFFDQNPEEYQLLVKKIFRSFPAVIANYGLKLHVNYQKMPSKLKSSLQNTPFLLDNSIKSDYLLTYSNSNDKHQLSLYEQNKRYEISKTNAEDLFELSNKFINKTFSNTD